MTGLALLSEETQCPRVTVVASLNGGCVRVAEGIGGPAGWSHYCKSGRPPKCSCPTAPFRFFSLLLRPSGP